MGSPRAGLYHALAEVLAETPEWLVLPGRAWPLFKSTAQLRQSSPVAQRAVHALAEIGAESLNTRRARYEKMFAGIGRPRIWLYESMYSSGRLFGPKTLAVEQVYKSAGVETVSAELPDHASVELAFLAHIATQQNLQPQKAKLWRLLEKRFIRQHAGRWLPNLGRALMRSSDEVYAPIGELLAGWLDEVIQPPVSGRVHSEFPIINQPEDCTLCGFCIQVCPTDALVIRETEDQTALWLSSERCIGCAKCSQVCQNGILEMRFREGKKISHETWLLLQCSPRACCPVCNQPTVSQAELNFVSEQLGNPPWLHTCHSCRAQEMENIV